MNTLQLLCSFQFGGITNEANMDTCVHAFPGHMQSYKGNGDSFCPVPPCSAMFQLCFILFAFTVEIRFLLVLATGAQARKTLTDLSRKSSG